MNEEQTIAAREFEAARKSLLAQPTVAQGAIRTETRYVEAYQNMVQAGLVPQIKAKYRFTGVAHRR